MTVRLAAVLVGLSAMGTGFPLQGVDGPQEKGPPQSFERTTVERVTFPSGGTIRLNGSCGYLTVEGWDEPEVEVIVTKSTDRFFKPEQSQKVEKRFDQIRVVTERPTDKQLAISTTLPVRNSLLKSVLRTDRIIVTMPVHTKRGVTVEYAVHVPRDSRLEVHHDNGYILVSDVTGDIEVDSHTGDMIVMLPDPGPYAIDARTRMGSVTSDFTGKGISQFLVGTHFTFASPAPSPPVTLRMGRGSITIKNGPPSGQFWKN